MSGPYDLNGKGFAAAPVVSALKQARIASLKRKVAGQAAEIARLRQALWRHGIHDAACAKRLSLFHGMELQACDCGFDAALTDPAPPPDSAT